MAHACYNAEKGIETMRIRFPILNLLLAGCLCITGSLSHAQELDTSDLQGTVKKQSGPPYDTSQYNFSKLEPTPEEMQPEPAKTVLTIRVQTLQDAILSEKGSVDWYGWYLAARTYLRSTGGLGNCQPGTNLKFYKDGQILPETLDPMCTASLAGRSFPLPRDTQLEALLLVIRTGDKTVPAPLSPDQLYSRIESQGKQRY